MAEKRDLKKGYFWNEANGKKYLRYKYRFKGKAYYHNCIYDPTTHEDEAYEEIRAWKYKVENPIADSRLVLPDFVKKYTLNDTLADALDIYIQFYKNIDPTRRRIKRPAAETVRVARDTISLIRRHPFGGIKLKNLREEDIQEFIFDLANKFTYMRGRTEFHYGANTCNKVYALLKGFTRDMKWEKALFSDVKKAIVDDNGQNTFHTKEADHDKRHLTEEEEERYVDALMSIKTNDDARDAILIMLDTAIRPGEVRGLKACDFLKKEKALNIVRNIPRGEDKETKSTKTNERRIAPLTEAGVKIIKKHLAQCATNDSFIFKRKAIGKHDGFDGYQYDKKKGITAPLPLTYQSIYRISKKAAKLAKIYDKNVFPYTARHTRVNEVFEKDSPKAAQAVAGHKDISTTMRYYTDTNKDLVFSTRDRRNLEQTFDPDDYKD